MNKMCVVTYLLSFDCKEPHSPKFINGYSIEMGIIRSSVRFPPRVNDNR